MSRSAKNKDRCYYKCPEAGKKCVDEWIGNVAAPKKTKAGWADGAAPTASSQAASKGNIGRAGASYVGSIYTVIIIGLDQERRGRRDGGNRQAR